MTSIYKEDAANHPLPQVDLALSSSLAPPVLDKRAKLMQEKMARLPQHPQASTFEGKLMAEIIR